MVSKLTPNSVKKNSKSDKKAEMKQIKEVSETKTSLKAKQIKLSEVEDSWTDISKNVRKFNNHLYAFLKAAKVTSVDNGEITLDVPFEFHKERIEAPKSREAINDTLKEILGFSMPVRCSVNETIQRKKPASADVVLKNIQKTEGSVAPAEVPAKKYFPKKRVSKRVEAIFADI